MGKAFKNLVFTNDSFNHKVFIHLLGISATGLLVLLTIIIIFIPRHQVASLKQDVANLRRENPEAVQDIIIAEKARLDAETAARLALIQGIGLIIITGYFSWLNYRSNQKKQSNEDYYKALEHLKDENCFVCIDGINALEQYIKIEKQHTQKVINILAAYIRDRSPRPLTPENQNLSRISTDIQEAMKVIAFSDRTYEGSETHHIDLTRTDLRGLILPPKANLKGINFEQTYLQFAELPEADFRGARFRFTKFKETSAELANFEDTDISTSYWHGAKLKGANFKNAICTEVHLEKADLEDVLFQGAILNRTSFKQAKNITEDKIRCQARLYERAIGLDGEYMT